MLVFMLVSGPHRDQQYIYSSAFQYLGQLLKIRDSWSLCNMQHTQLERKFSKLAKVEDGRVGMKK